MGKISKERIKVGSVLVKRIPASVAEYRAYHEHYWRGYLCPGKPPKEEIGMVGRLIEVTSLQQLHRERKAYRVELDPDDDVQFTYYEVIDAGA